METAIPQRLGDFEIVRQIGRGGMGVVYEARQLSLNRPVALKVLSGGLGLTPKAVQRFRREAGAAATHLLRRKQTSASFLPTSSGPVRTSKPQVSPARRPG